MSGWQFALSRRWLGYLAVTVVFAVVCSLLGVWQFARRAEARAEISRIDANYDAIPVPVTDALPELTSFSKKQKWTPVLLEGRYLVSEQLLVRNRPYGGQPGFEVLTPLLLDDGRVFIVDRGWVPTGSFHDAPDTVPGPPTGRVTVTAHLKASEPTIAGRTMITGSGEVPTIDLPQIAEIVSRPLYTSAYGLVASESPAVTPMPAPSLRPLRDEGPHLSYALQWYLFAILGFVGLGWALRQEYRSFNADDPDERERAAERLRERAARPKDDAEVEDAILDAR